MTQLAVPGEARSTTCRYTDRLSTVKGLPAFHPYPVAWMVSASPPIGTAGSGPTSDNGCTRAAWCTSPHRHSPGSAPPCSEAEAQAAASAPGTAASTRSLRCLPASEAAGTGPPSSSQVSLASHRRTRVVVGAGTPDAIHSHVRSPSTGRYSPAASAR
jgi:hypothetical protein